MKKLPGKIDLIAVKAKQDKKMKFTSLIHHFNVANLASCYRELKRDKACGIDGVTVDGYGENLEENLANLVERLKRKQYRPQPVRRVLIPKPGKSEKRILGIPSVEDKLVQLLMKKIIESIYEPMFLEFSYGFRPGRNCHQAVNSLDKEVMQKPINCVVEVDIQRYFDNVQHYWLLRCIEERITDPNFIWLIKRFLKAGYVESGAVHKTLEGTPQGGVISPLFANIYLHYVLDMWLSRVFKPKCRGYMVPIRYCDDFVVCFEYRKEAERFLSELKARLGKFGLTVSPEKTCIHPFGRQAWKRAKRYNLKLETFNFLGFTHYCGTSRRGKFIVGHKTTKQNLHKSIRNVAIWLRKIRCMVPMREWWPILKAKLNGHYAYFGISGNMRCIKQFYRQVISLIFKWQNRRSQKRSMNWQRFCNYLKWYPLPQPKIFVNLYTLSPIRVNATSKSPVRENCSQGSVGALMAMKLEI